MATIPNRNLPPDAAQWGRWVEDQLRKVNTLLSKVDTNTLSVQKQLSATGRGAASLHEIVDNLQVEINQQYDNMQVDATEANIAAEETAQNLAAAQQALTAVSENLDEVADTLNNRLHEAEQSIGDAKDRLSDTEQDILDAFGRIGAAEGGITDAAAEAAAAKTAADKAVADALAAIQRAEDAETAAGLAETAADTSAQAALDALSQAQAAGGDATAAQAAAVAAQEAADAAASQAGIAGTAAAKADADAAQAAADAAAALAQAAAAASSADTSADEAAAAKQDADAAVAAAQAAYTRAEAAETAATGAAGSASAAETAADASAADALAALQRAQAAEGDAVAAQAAADAAQAAADAAETHAEEAGTTAAAADAKAARAAADAAQAVADAAAAKTQSASAVSAASSAQTKADQANAAAAAAEAEAIAAEQRALSRGAQLVTNGTGYMKDNTNFSVFTFDPLDSPTGTTGSFDRILRTPGTGLSDEVIPVSTDRSYTFSYQARQKNPDVTHSRHYGMVAPVDSAGNPISPTNYVSRPGTLTTLAQPLKRGDTVVRLTSAAHWINNAGASGHWRSINFWNYKDATGKVWPPETYTRWTSPRNLYEDGGINYATSTITLRAPWTGPEYGAGHPVSNSGDGGSFMYITGNNMLVPQEWTTFSGSTLPGVHDAQAGVPLGGNPTSATTRLPPGTAGVRVGWLTNYSTVAADNSIQSFAAVSLIDATAQKEAEAARAAAAAAKADADKAQARADAAHTLAGTASTNAAAAMTSASAAGQAAIDLSAAAETAAKAHANQAAATAEANAKSAAATDATNKANAAKTAAEAAAKAYADLIDTGASDADIAAARTYAEQQALAARQAAEADAKAKADAAQAEAIRLAAIDATTKANAARDAAQATANNLPKVLHGTTVPTGTAPAGSIWWQHGKVGPIASGLITSPIHSFSVLWEALGSGRIRMTMSDTPGGTEEWSHWGINGAGVALNRSDVRSIEVTATQTGSMYVAARSGGGLSEEVEQSIAVTAAMLGSNAAQLSDPVIGQWNRVGTSWVSTPITSEAIANLDVGKLTAGSAEIPLLTSQKIGAAVGSFVKADIGNLVVTDGAVMNEAVVDRLYTDVVNSRKITTDMLLVGPGENLVVNPSFLEDSDGVVTGWTSTSDASFIDGIGKGGHRGARISGSTSAGSYVEGIIPVINPGESYRVRVWAKPSGTSNITIAMAAEVRFFTASGSLITGLSRAGSPAVTSGEWHKVEAIITAPENAVSATIRLRRGTAVLSHVDFSYPSVVSATDSSLLVDGAVTARALNVVPDDPTAGGLELVPQGLSILVPGEDGGEASRAIQLRSDLEQSLGFIENGAYTYSVSQDGQLVSRTGSFNDSLLYRGDELELLLGRLPRGVIAHSRNTVNATVGTSNARLLGVTFITPKDDRRIKVTIRGHAGTTNPQAYFYLVQSTGNSVTWRNDMQENWYLSPRGGGESESFEWTYSRNSISQFGWPSEQQITLGVFARVLTSGSMTFTGGNNQEIIVEDVGPATTITGHVPYVPSGGGGTGGGNENAQPTTRQYSQAFYSTWVQSFWRGNGGAQYPYTPQAQQRGYTGQWAAGNGVLSALWGFNRSAITNFCSGADMVSATLTLENQHTGTSRPLTAELWTARADSRPNNYSQRGLLGSPTFTRGQRREMGVDSAMGELKNGNTSAFGIHPVGWNTQAANYGYFGTQARLIITVRK